MNSTVENGQLFSLTGMPKHPYTQGKLCAKGYSYLEKNSHLERLRYPYFQEIKGSGKFKQITWNKAFDIILCELLNIDMKYGDFLPLALFKGTGNVGVHHFVTDHFFNSLSKTTRVHGSSAPSTGFEAIQYDMGTVKMSDPHAIKDSGMILVWGANPAATNIHLIPFIIEAKTKGAKLVVIDPIYTQTAELADLYIQISPSTDGALANILIKELLKTNHYDKEFVDNHSYGSYPFFDTIKQIDIDTYLQKCGISEEAVLILLDWIKGASAVSHIIGIGLQKHTNGGQSIRAIEALAAVHGDIGKKGSGIYFRRMDAKFFKNQQTEKKNRNIYLTDRDQRVLPQQLNKAIELLWISCANPIIQEPNPQFILEFLKEIPFVVTVDLFMTPTAQMSNLILPTTTHFEEIDIVTSYWHKEIALNEKAVNPYFESLSEWNIMKEMALRLSEKLPDKCSFPIHSSEEEYLNSQFTDEINEYYFVKNVSDLKQKRFSTRAARTVWEKRSFATKSGLYQFYSAEAEENGLATMPLFVNSLSPTAEHPFWLITPHNPYGFNSQFHVLNLSNEDEAFVEIHPMVAKGFGIYDREIIKIFNEQDCIEIRAVYSDRVPKDILVIYHRWYVDSEINVNKLISVLPTDMGQHVSGSNGTAFYDTFVQIGKL
jgi:anaerobic selenocysteine-containing dehydrogenase